MKRWIAVGAGAVVIAIIVIASVRSSGGTGEQVYLEKVEKRDIESIVSAPGEIEPKVKVNISAHVIGKIEKLYFEEGDFVTKGQKLVELEKVAYKAARDRSQSQLASSRIEVNRREIALADAERQFKRASDLRSEGVQAEQLYDQAKLDLENARAALAAAHEAVRQAAAALEQAEDDLERTTIVAPMDGKIVQKNAEEGEVVITGTMNNPGSVIAVLADMSEILAIAEVGETEVVGVEIGQRARVNVDAVTDFTYEGHVIEIGSSANTRAAVGTGIRYFRVKVHLENADEKLRPGMTSQVDIVTNSVKDVLAVPVQCVVERDPAKIGKGGETSTTGSDVELKKYVLLNDGGKVKLVEVETGISDATHVAIESGLQGGEEIITGPFRTLRRLDQDDEIRPREEKADKGSDSKGDEETEE